MPAPLFSIIIPTYNRRDLLLRTLESIPRDGDSQIIVVDDGSTDGTLEMLDGMKDRVLSLRQTNGGPGPARNRGAAAATGEYLAFLDSDDLWFPWTLAAYRQTIEQHNRPAFVAGKPFSFTVESELSGASSTELKTNFFQDYYASGDEWRWFGASSFVIRRDAFEAAGGFCGLPGISGEDCDLTLRLGIAKGFVQISEPATFGYRYHPGNLTKDLIRCNNNLRLFISQEREGKYPGSEDRRAERQRILTRHTRSGSITLLNGGSLPEAGWVYRQSFAWNLRQARFKYLLAFPAMYLARRIRP